MEQDHFAFTGRESVIVIPLLQENDTWKLLYEVRSSGLRTQPGEVCFPGGKIEEGESAEEAAKRECCEELCIEDEQIRLIACLGTLAGPREQAVTVFADLLCDYGYTFSEDESSRVFSVSLEDLRQNALVQHVTSVYSADERMFRDVPGGLDWLNHPSEREMYFFRTDPVIWGFTARITAKFLDLWTRVVSRTELE
ncbi:MAG: NUDIX domain-containing protein [Solobacterium sp.]|nr:NUDIX domain-containing protein [Solobacterium sp.]